jgi:surface antigen
MLSATIPAAHGAVRDPTDFYCLVTEWRLEMQERKDFEPPEPHRTAMVSSAIKYVMVLALLPVMTSVAAAEGLINPFDTTSVGLSKEDSELMKGALKTVLDAKKAGATAEWKSSSSGRTGRATSLDTFEKDGMSCANVEHAFTAGGGSTYRLPFCQTSDGTWKIAF